MKKTQNNLTIFQIIFTVSLVISNVVTGKLLYTGVNLFGTVITLPGAVFCYAITFLMTDVIGEIWGKKEANATVRYGFIGQILATALIILTRYIPTADNTVQEAYVTLLGQNYIFVLGSMIAYYASQTWDVYIFHKIRARFMRKGGHKGKRWIWNNASTMTSQIIDTVLFIGISFGIGFGWLFDKTMLPQLFTMMIGQYLFKFIIAALDTPFFYFFTRNREQYIKRT